MTKLVIVTALLSFFMSVAVLAPHSTAPIVGKWRVLHEPRPGASWVIDVWPDGKAVFATITNAMGKRVLQGETVDGARALFLYEQPVDGYRHVYTGKLQDDDTLVGVTYEVTEDSQGRRIRGISHWKAARLKN